MLRMQVSHQTAENVDCVKELGHDSRESLPVQLLNVKNFIRVTGAGLSCEHVPGPARGV